MGEAMVAFTWVDARFQAPVEDSPFHTWTTAAGTAWAIFYRSGADYLLRFPGLADFQIGSNGCWVRCWSVPDVSDDTVQHLYLNQVVPLALSRQHRLVLHGSAVEIADAAVVFLGQSGAGKSTLAASFATNGYRMLSDDGVLLEYCQDAYQVRPSHPSIRLWADSQAALFGRHARLAPPVQYTDKARILADERAVFCPQARSLQRIYLLGDGTAKSPVFWPVTARDALIELVKHSFMLEVEAPEMLAFHFERLTALANQPFFSVWIILGASKGWRRYGRRF